mmetsp:Transcript_6531/g.14919  ORF Transcript_6531/g.14919 Transcript_6531/m.14919 type:complete len:91 (-) Transcript_6531:247-519(-)|eukprot:767017-Hanusia_phi.AAC.8
MLFKGLRSSAGARETILSIVSGVGGKGKEWGQYDSDAPSGYTYANDAGGYSDGSSECNYDNNGLFHCKLTQPTPSAFPGWMGPPDSWNAH